MRRTAVTVVRSLRDRRTVSRRGSSRVGDRDSPEWLRHARAAVPLPVVRSAVWMDHKNLLVMVEGAEYRNADMIDRFCMAIDTLAIVVNVQDVTSQTRDGAAAQ